MSYQVFHPCTYLSSPRSHTVLFQIIEINFFSLKPAQHVDFFAIIERKISLSSCWLCVWILIPAYATRNIIFCDKIRKGFCCNLSRELDQCFGALDVTRCKTRVFCHQCSSTYIPKVYFRKLENIEKGIKINEKIVNNIRYADDIVILTN